VREAVCHLLVALLQGVAEPCPDRPLRR